MAPYGACKSYKAEFEEVQHSEGQISKTIEQSRRKERREVRGGKKEKRSEKLCRCGKIVIRRKPQTKTEF